MSASDEQAIDEHGDGERPRVVLIGGASGTGKSTVAREVAHRLRVHHLVSTDVIRRSLRTAVPYDRDAPLHHESFDVPSQPGETTRDGVSIDGFEAQAATVRRAIDAVLEHAELEHWDSVVEGVHLIPQTSTDTITYVLLAALDAEAHRAHFGSRDASSRGKRPAQHYLEHFAALRTIQDHLVARARALGAPVIDTTAQSTEQTVLKVLELIEHRRKQPPATTAE